MTKKTFGLLTFFVVLMSAASPAQAGNGPTPLSPAWFAARAGVAGSSASAAAATPQLQSLANVHTSLQSLKAATAALQKAQAAQAAAASTLTAVPDGLTIGGLQLQAGSAPTNASLPKQTVSSGRTQVTITQTAPQAILNWSKFNVGSNTTLKFDQSAGGASASSWAALNRVTDPSTNPTQILGNITAQGQVYIINPNGIVFGSGSQVNLHALVASSAAFSDSQFLAATSGAASGGLYATTPTFTGATAPVIVAPGATITTAAPASATSGGGFVLLFGSTVQNGGAITTPDGQTVLAAGTNFILQPGYSVGGTGTVTASSSGTGNVLPSGAPTTLPVGTAVPIAGTTGSLTATVVGSLVAPIGSGTVTNTGIITAATGDITLAGSTVTQAGVLLATTSVSQRGTIHLMSDLVPLAASPGNYALDPNASIVLAPAAATLILNDTSGATALDSQRASSLNASIAANQQYASLAAPPLLQYVRLPDQQNQSRIEITSGGTIDFQSGSLTMATGGQIATSAGTGSTIPTAGRVVVEAGATLDVAGSLAAVLPVSANALSVQIESFELRDDPLNRDTNQLNSSTVSVDARQLVTVAASTSTSTTGSDGYSATRNYTAGGLLEVSGELGNVGHTIDEFTATGGTVTLAAPLVMTRPGSVINIAGGAVTYQAGAVPQSWLIAADGQLYNVNTAPSSISYNGLYNGQNFSEPRWNVSATFREPLVAPTSFDEPGYLVGRDAGTLTVSAATAVVDGTLYAGVVTGTYQDAARTSGLADPFLQPQNAVPLGGALDLATFGTIAMAGNATGLEVLANPTTVTIGSQAGAGGVDLGIATAVPDAVLGTTSILADALTNAQLGGLSIIASVTGGITVNAPMTFGNGAVVSLVAPSTVINANLVARGGSVMVTDTLTLASSDQTNNPVLSGNKATAALTQNEVLAPGVTIDTRGVWTNALLDPINLAGEAYLNGGGVSFTSTRGIALGAGSLIDASSGGAITAQATTIAGAGGAIAISADTFPLNATPGPADPVSLLGTLRSVGGRSCPVSGGCGFTLTAPSIAIGDGLTPATTTQLVLPTAFFQSGFLSYSLNGTATTASATGTLSALNDTSGNALPGISVAAGAHLSVVAPTYQFTQGSRTAPTGTDPASALSQGLLPLYLPNPQTATVTQRPAPSLSLSSEFGATHNGGAITIGSGASVSVDPGASVSLRAAGSILVAGAISAPGGTISLVNDINQLNSSSTLTYVPGQTILLADGAVLDVAGRAYTALDRNGRPFGTVLAGGSIEIGGPDVLTNSSTGSSTDSFVIIAQGAILNASGTSAVIDPAAGLGPGLVATLASEAGSRSVPSAGGEIALNSESGIILDGTMLASAGGAGAAGGNLIVTAETPKYAYEIGSNQVNAFPIPDYLRTGRDLVLESNYRNSGLTDAMLASQASAAMALQPLVGQTKIGVDQISSAGFASVTLSTQDALIFSGSVSLSAPRSISLNAGALGEPPGAGLAQVLITAPYVSLSGLGGQAIYNPAIDPAVASASSGYTKGVGNLSPSQVLPTASLTVAAGQIDMSGFPAFGQAGTIGLGGSSTVTGGKTMLSAPEIVIAQETPTGGVVTTNLVDFAAINLLSTGNIRFLNDSALTGGAITTLLTAGTITLQAQQIYPASNVTAQIIAGAKFSGTGQLVEQPGGLISILGDGGALPDPPQAIGGSLIFIANTIDQGGIVRAPLGSLQIGVTTGLITNANAAASGIYSIATPGGASGLSLTSTGSAIPLTQTVLLQAGSVTSVSANGLTIAEGGTTDGTTYCATPSCSSALTLTQLPRITLAGENVIEQSGAMLDLSGGGTLAGIGFITGAGGSVDTLATPTLSLSNGGKQPSNPIYAIVVGPQPSVAEASLEGYAAPSMGQQVTIPAGIQGLPAGTYTLLPADNALRPGGYRVELTASNSVFAAPVALTSGSFQTDVRTSIVSTSIASIVPVVAIVTPAAKLRDNSQYDEETYSQYVQAQAALQGVPRIRAGVLTATGGYNCGTSGCIIPQDAGQLVLNFEVPTGTVASPPLASALNIQGTNNFAAATGGYGGEAIVTTLNTVEITPQPKAPALVSAATLLLDAPDLTRLGADVLTVGGAGGTIDAGATLSAPEVLFTGSTLNGAISTIGRSGTLESSSAGGLIFSFGGNSPTSFVLASNAVLQFNNSAATSNGTLVIGSSASLAAGGSLIFGAGSLTLPTTAQYGAASIQLSANNVLLGTPAALAAASNVPSGVVLTSSTLAALVAGNPTTGAPALQSLILTAQNSVDVFGAVSLAAGSLQQVELNTPSIQGFSTSPADLATITANTFVWNGYAPTATSLASAVAPLPATGGPGTGSGGLKIAANTIIFGYGDGEIPYNESISLDRVLFGFSSVTFAAARAIIARDQGTLILYQSNGALAAIQPANGIAYSGTGGSLTLDTPLLTAANAAILQISAGGPISLISSSGNAANLALAGQGGEIDLTGQSITAATNIALPAGKLSMLANTGDITLSGNAAVNLAGVTTTLFDQSQASPGGSVVLEATVGNITAAPGSQIDVSAQAANAGSIEATALAGVVSLNGALTGGSQGGAGGSLTLRTGSFSQSAFDQLQTTLNTGGFTAARAIEIGTGTIAVTGGAGAANQVRASQVNLSVDQGSLSVSGVVDASGPNPGAISLAAGSNLTIAPGAVLDAHATVLHTDSNNLPIDAENQATIQLTVATGNPGAPGTGILSIGNGAVLDVASPELLTASGVAPGVVTMSVPRLLTASGAETGNLPLRIGNVITNGVGSLVINAFRAFAPITAGTVSQGDFDTLFNPDSAAFIGAAEPGGKLAAGLATQLGAFASNPALHLRPGVEIVTSGNLTISGDINLAGYRYASLDAANALTGTYGSGEPGTLVIRAGGNLTVNGSITDGFALPNDGSGTTLNPDDNGWVLTTQSSALLGNVTLPPAAGTVTLAGSPTGTAATTTSFQNTGSLNFDIVIDANTLKSGIVVPVPVTLGAAISLPTGTTPTANITSSSGAVVVPQGVTLAKTVSIPAGDTLAAGFTTTSAVTTKTGLTWQAGDSLADFSSPVVLNTAVTVGPGAVIPANSTLFSAAGKPSSIKLRAQNSAGIQGLIYADAAPLPQGSLSWSIDITSGANLAAADPLAVQSLSALSQAGSGNLLLSDPHVGLPGGGSTATQSLSVLRTGTGNLNLVAGNNFSEQTLFGVYTAGAAVGSVPSGSQIASDATTKGLVSADYATAAAANAQAAVLTGGGNLTIAAQGDLSGYIYHQVNSGSAAVTAPNDSSAIGQWLWRQGGSNLGEPASWGVNTGTYVPSYVGGNPTGTYSLAGFSGFGTLGGGNVTLMSGGNAGVTTPPVVPAVGNPASISSGGLVVAVASGSYVDATGVRQTVGGGDITMHIGGSLNAVPTLSSSTTGVTVTALDGTITDLRGVGTIGAGEIGQIASLSFGSQTNDPSLGIYAPLATSLVNATPEGGPALVPGDATFTVSTRGILVVAGIGDSTRVLQDGAPDRNSVVQSWFTLWTPKTSVTLVSAGGDVWPVSSDAGNEYLNIARNEDPALSSFETPSQLSIVADAGSIFQYLPPSTPLIILAPEATGQLNLFAGGSIYNADFQLSGADPEVVATVANPADYNGTTRANNIALPTSGFSATNFLLFAFGPDAVTPNLHAANLNAPNLNANDNKPIQIYAGGDILYASFGSQSASADTYYPVGSTTPVTSSNLYPSGKSVWLRAGGDVVGLGETVPGTVAPMLVLNTGPNSLSLVQAARDIIEANIDVYGPGALEVSAGRELYQANSGTILSEGAFVPGTLASGQGAALTVLAGVTSSGPDTTGFANLYFNPANLADPNLPLQDQPDKVLKTYQAALLTFMQSRGYTGSAEGALAAFEALDPAVQTPFLLGILFDELAASGQAASDPASRFYKSYLQGNDAIAALFPSGTAYQGDVTMYGASGLKTLDGGGIDLVVPGGQTVLGVASQSASASSGLLTQGSGDIGILSQGSVLLGQSRVFTTFGGAITMWSEQGDINAGQGAKTTQVFTPPEIAYDLLGNVTLSPTAPATGAGIATLAPVAGVPPGNVVLVAPLGTIDAGEAGIRSTGNVALAATVVLNASNIQAGGKTTGAPTVPTVDVSASVNAAATAGSTATSTLPSANPNVAPSSFITVEVDIPAGGDTNDERKKKKP